MGFIERLATPPQKNRPAGKSIMDVWVETRPESQRAAIRTAAANPEWGHVALLDELVAEGAPAMSDTAFRQWRKKVGLP